MDLIQIFFTFTSIIIVLFFFSLFDSKRRCTAPMAAGAWPIIGHLHLFGSHQLTHKTLASMADKCGPAFTIKLGSHKNLVISSQETAKECFTALDKVFSYRPTLTSSRLLGYNGAMFGFAQYGAYWREMRKIATVELLSNHRIDMLKHIRSAELGIILREIYDIWEKKGRPTKGVLIDMKQKFLELTHNVALRMVGGKRYFDAIAEIDEGERKRCQKVMVAFFRLVGVFVLSDAFPYLGWLDFHGGEKEMKRTAKELDEIVGGWLEEHKKDRLLCQKKEEQDFMDAMLNILEDSQVSGFDADTIIKATCLNLVLAASDTNMVTLTWTLSLLLNNPRVIKKAQDELDTHIGKTRQVEESDISKLVYLQAIVKETLRLYPPGPIIGFHEAAEDCTLSNGNYYIPKGTRLLVNLWKLHRDPRVWSDPESFEPERFLTSHKEIDVRGKNFEFIPFGSGRRMCPGVSLALQVVHYALAKFLHSFEFSSVSSEDVDMTESAGLTNLKATPVEVLITPRLDSKFY